MKFSIVIPTIQQFSMLFNDCINSFVTHNGDCHEIIVVDDGSDQRLQSQIAQECLKRNVKFLINEKNMGFPITVNKGIKIATGDVVLLVNNDVRFTHNVVEPIRKYFQIHERIGIIGSLLFYPHGTIQHGGIYSHAPGAFGHRGYHKTYEQAPEVHKSEYLIAVTGALFAIRKEALNDIGYMNEEYFLACDDTEYCLRAWEKDWRVFYSPEIRAIHAEGHTRGANNLEKLKKNRTWLFKENETIKKFHAGIHRFDWPRIHGKVAAANAEMNGQVKPPVTVQSTGTCEKRIFEKAPPQSVQSIGKHVTGSKVLAVRRTGALGDVLLTTGIVRKLKEQHPDHQVWVSTVCGEIFRNNPFVSGVVRTLQEIPSPSQVIDLDLAYEKHPKQSMLKSYADSAQVEQALPELYSDATDLASMMKKLPHVNFSTDKIAVIHMSVGWENRTWPRPKWMEVTKKLSGLGLKCVVIGRGADYRSDLYAGVFNAVDQLSIHEIRELMKKSHLFVGMDSGMFHIAQTTQIPAICLFTVADPENRIVDRVGKTVAVIPKVQCRFCLHEQEPPVTFVRCRYGTNDCLKDFSPDFIVDEARHILL